MSLKTNKAAEKMNENDVVVTKKFGSRTAESTTKSEDTFVKYGEFGKYHNFGASIVKKETGDNLLKKSVLSEKLMFRGGLINYISLNYNKDQIYDLIQSAILKEDIESEILKEIYLKDDHVIMVLNKNVILKKRETTTLVDASTRNLKSYVDMDAIPESVLNLALVNQIYSFGDEFALKLSYKKIASRIIAPSIIHVMENNIVKSKPINNETKEEAEQKAKEAAEMNFNITREIKRNIMSTWTLGNIVVKNNIVAICFCMEKPSDIYNITVDRKNFVVAQFGQDLADFSQTVYEYYLRKQDADSKIMWSNIGNVLEAISKEAVQKSYILKSKDSTNSLVKIPLIKLPTSDYIRKEIPDHLKFISQVSRITSSLNDESIKSRFSDIINSTLVTLSLEDPNFFVVLPDLYKIAHAAVLSIDSNDKDKNNYIDPTLKTSVRTSDSSIAIVLSI